MINDGMDSRVSERCDTVQALLRSRRGLYRGTAIECDGRSVTYPEFELVTEGIASALAADGIRPGDYVAVRMTRSERMIEALFGVLLSGAALVPVNPDIPDERFDAIRTACDIRVTIDDAAFEAFLNASARGAVSPLKAMPEDPAVVLFTSGSTGTPKGVCQSQRSFAYLFDQFPYRVPPIGVHPAEYSAVIGHLQPGFIVAYHYEYPSALLNGKKLLLLNETERTSVAAFSDALERNDRCLLAIMPTQLAVFMENERFRAALSRGASALQFFTEPVSDALRNRIATTVPKNVTAISLYGQTETFGIGWRDIYDPEDGMVLSTDVRLRMLRENGTEADPGERAEICVHSPTLFSCYLMAGTGKDGQALSEAQLRAKTILLDGERFVRTGDLGRLTPSGRIQLLGRNDRMVKLHGQRIELAEVEACLMRREDVPRAVAVLCEEGGPPFLAAFYEGARALDPDALRRYLLKFLPPYSVPSLLIHMEALPNGQNGKPETRQLVAIAARKRQELLSASVVGSGEGTDREKLILASVVDALNLSPQSMSPTTNLISLGIDSLSALMVIAKLNERGWSISIHDFFTAPTPRELATHLMKKGKQSVDRESTVSAVWPVTDMQDWWNRYPYRVVKAYTTSIPLTEAQLRTRLERAVRRHPALRSAFFNTDGAYYTRVLARKPANMAFFDLRGLPSDPKARIASDMVRLRNAQDGALLTVWAYRINEAETALIMAGDHRVSDGMTERLLLGEMLSDSPMDGQDSYISYLEYIHDAERLEEAKAFWKEYLSGTTPAFPVPARTSGVPSQTRTFSVRIDPERTTRLAEKCRREDVTLSSMVVYQYGATLSELLDAEDICFYTCVSGRCVPVEGIDHTVGCITEVVPVRYRRDQTPLDFMKGCLDADRHSFLPRRQIFEAAFGWRQVLAIAPYINSLIFPDIGEVPYAPLFELDYGMVPVGNFLWMSEGALHLALHFDAALWDMDFAARLARGMEARLKDEGETH